MSVRVRWRRINGFPIMYELQETCPEIPMEIARFPLFCVWKYTNRYVVETRGKFCMEEIASLDRKMKVQEVKAYVETLARMKGIDIKVVR